MQKQTQQQTVLKATALVLALVLAPAAHAGAAMPRDTGVGQHVATQGNQALLAIKAELRAALRATKPALPAARVVKMSQPAGATVATGTTVRCAE